MKHAAYASARALVDDGDVLLFKGRGIIAFCIRALTWSSYTHVGIALWGVLGGRRTLFVAEAREGIPGGVRLYPLSLAVRSHHVDLYAWADGHDPNREGMAGKAADDIGRPYGWIGLLKIGVLKLPLLRAVLAFSHRRKWARMDNGRWTESLVCSARVQRWARLGGGRPLVQNLPDALVTPAMIARSVAISHVCRLLPPGVAAL